MNKVKDLYRAIVLVDPEVEEPAAEALAFTRAMVGKRLALPKSCAACAATYPPAT